LALLLIASSHAFCYHISALDWEYFFSSLLEQRASFGSAAVVLDALVRQVGLFPYLTPRELGTSDQIAWELNRPANMPEEIVFHEPQTRVYRSLLEGNNVVLSAPTSFGKSLVTDAVIASDKFKNILIVVPTIALID